MTSADLSQRAVLGFLLERHPAMIGAAELDEALADVDAVDEAVRRLADDGVVRRLGDRVGLTRAAVRMGELHTI